MKLVEKRQNKKEIVLEEFICQLYGYWNKSTDSLLSNLWQEVYQRK